jgi:hypothetical protein
VVREEQRTAVGKKKQRVNPFYVLLVLAGVAFAITACAYGVMAVKQMHASDLALPGQTTELSRPPADPGFIHFMEQHGNRLMVVELAVLGLMTMAAIGTDRLWSGDD